MSYTAEWTGPTNSLLLLLRELRDVYQVAVVLPGRGRFHSALEREGIRSVVFPSISKRYLPRLVALIRRGKFDLVYANTPDGTSRLAFVAARLAGAKYVCHVRALGWTSKWSKLAHLGGADAVIAVSKATARSVERFVERSRLHVVYNGIEVTDSRDGSPPLDLRRELGWPPDSLVLIGVANVCERKGQEYAAAAMRLLSERVPAARLVLVGRLEREPAYVESLKRKIRRHRLGDRIALLGFREDVAGLLKQVDMMIHTALADPHPRAVLEAMAGAVPVIAFSVDGVAETVVHEQTGLLVSPGDSNGLADAVVRLSRNGDCRRVLGEAGRVLVREKFSYGATAGGVMKVIDGVLGQHSRASRWTIE